MSVCRRFSGVAQEACELWMKHYQSFLAPCASIQALACPLNKCPLSKAKEGEYLKMKCAEKGLHIVLNFAWNLLRTCAIALPGNNCNEKCLNCNEQHINSNEMSVKQNKTSVKPMAKDCNYVHIHYYITAHIGFKDIAKRQT